MEPKQKVEPAKVLEAFREHNNILKVAEIADQFNCSQVTARVKVKKLRMQGHSILPTKDGLILVDIVNEHNADKVRKTGDWLIGEMKGMGVIGSVTKKPLYQVRKILELSKEERQQLKTTLVLLTNLITAANVEEDLK